MVASAFVFCALMAAAVEPAQVGTLEEAFENPPQSAGAVAWWHWCDGNVTEKGITRDFEAMKAAGLSGATVFHGGFGFPQDNTLDPELTFRSPKWWHAMQHAAKEAKRLGLDFGFHNCPGYSTSGGPWITPEQAMKKIVCSTDGSVPKADPRFYRDIATVSVTNIDGKVVSYRLGYTITGKCTHPTPRDIIGKTLEADKLSTAAMRVHWDNVFAETARQIPIGYPGLRHVLMDSYEAGDCNWSENFREDFIRLRGYDPVPLLPILFGAKIGSAEHDERFREDMKLTVQELYNECHYSTFAAEAHRYGLYVQLEPYSGPFDPYEAASYADEPMTEFWAFPCFWEKTWSPVKFGGAYHAGGIGRALGREICGAESFTAMPMDDPWKISPRYLKRSLDATFANGVNRIHLHHWTHQPFDPSVQPGFSMGFWGTHFGECQTWFESGKAFYRYLQRCQALLQRGRLMVDAIGLNWDYGRWDAVSRSHFLSDLTVRPDGRVAMPCGRSYDLFMLPKDWKPTLAEMEKLAELVKGGAAVWGKRPERLLGLAGGVAAEARFKELVTNIWNGKNPRLFENCTEDDALAKLGIKPAFEVVSKVEKGAVLASPREENGHAFFFVSNQTTNELAFTAAFRTRDRFAEVWYPASGKRFALDVRASADARALADLKLVAEGSCFVVFSSEKSALAAEPARATPTLKLNGLWTLAINGKSLDNLKLPHDWSKEKDDNIAAFSGTAVYRTRFTLDAAKGPRELRLGKVGEIAHVRLNGHDLGVAWYGDFSVFVPDGVLKAGENELEVEIANTWMNRLIADEKLPSDCEWLPQKEEGLRDFYQRPRRYGSGLKRLPDWLLKGEKRPSGRQAFCPWNYFLGTDFEVPPSGLMGPVVLSAPIDDGSCRVAVDFTKPTGKIKNLHSVNNAPCRVQKGAKVWEFEEAGIPLSRTHDAVGMWGGAHYVDIPNIFPNFDADENDPKNYDFAFTDAYLSAIVAAGTKIYYRLGVTIENNWRIKAYNIFPPKDFAKWARICEHVVRHYNEGWANGFKWDIEYWEIWNEPENPPLWQGTREQFFELYRITANHLKSCFPKIKVGGYGSCGFYAIDDPEAAKNPFQQSFVSWFDAFLKYVSDPKTKAPLDFYPWHLYLTDRSTRIATHARYVREKLDQAGFVQTESHLNEWNHVGPNWNDFVPMRNAKGAARVGEAFCVMQRESVDMALYYDACPTRSYCGLLHLVADDRRTPAMHVFRFWNRLYRLGTSFDAASTGDGVDVAAAGNGDDRAIFIVNNTDRVRNVTLDLRGAEIAAFRAWLVDDVHKGLADSGVAKSANRAFTLGHRQVMLIATPKTAAAAVQRGIERKVFAGQDASVH